MIPMWQLFNFLESMTVGAIFGSFSLDFVSRHHLPAWLFFVMIGAATMANAWLMLVIGKSIAG